MNSIVLKKTEVTLFILFTAIIFQWIPERNIPYLIPFIIYIALSLINPELFFSCFKIFLFIGLIYVHSLFATGLNGTELFYGNLFIFIITNSAVIIFLLMPSSWFLGEKLLEKIIKLIIFVTIFQSIIGIFQAFHAYSIFRTFDSNSGDLVTGTINLFHSSNQNKGFANPIFVFNIIMYCLFIFSYGRNRWSAKLSIFLGITAVLFASVIHLNIFSLSAMLIASVLVSLRKININRVYKLVIGVIVFFTIFSSMNYLQPRNINNLEGFFYRAIDLDIPKVAMVHRLSSEVSNKYPAHPYIGFGAGQFNSKASLISSGNYIRRGESLNIEDAAMSVPLKEYVLDLWVLKDSYQRYRGSTMSPWSSVLALWGEFGLVFLIVVFFLYLLFLFSFFLNIKNKPDRKMFSIISMSLFVIFAGMHEHYFETPQAVFIPLLLLKMLIGDYRQKTS